MRRTRSRERPGDRFFADTESCSNAEGRVAVRLWSVHPQYFDRQALTAAWREALLAQAVLGTPGRGYGNHPQLERFREQPVPMDAIAGFLTGLVDEADARGYRFAREKITGSVTGVLSSDPSGAAALAVTTGQLSYEWAHLRTKLERRSPEVAERWAGLDTPQPHPLFRVIDGPIASWERIAREGEAGASPGAGRHQPAE